MECDFMAKLTRYSNLELLKLPDCCRLLENGKCESLDGSDCFGENCYYYNSQDKVFTRLRSLDEEKQEHISKKYYSGKRPWRAAAERPQS